MAGQNVKPPEFLKDISGWKQYKRNLERWDRCTSVDKKMRGDTVLLHIPDGHKLKERLERDLGIKWWTMPRG